MAETQRYGDALPTGQTLEEYRLNGVLGQGGFGITYKADDLNLGNVVAIKEFLPIQFAHRQGGQVTARTSDDEASFKWGLDRFVEEARTLARFKHANIVRVQRIFRANGTAYMVTEFEPGMTMAAWLRSLEGPPPEDRLKSISQGVLAALEKLHEDQFLHRDIKPDNIYLCADGRPMLLDFGSARQALGHRTKNLTELVTPGYAPLEQYHQNGHQGPWSDIYAMGAVLYRAISGERPPDSPSRVKRDPYVTALASARAPYDRAFLEAIDWALRPDEDDRPKAVADWWPALIGGAPSPQIAAPPRRDEPDRNTDIVRIDAPLLSTGFATGTVGEEGRTRSEAEAGPGPDGSGPGGFGEAGVGQDSFGHDPFSGPKGPVPYRSLAAGKPDAEEPTDIATTLLLDKGKARRPKGAPARKPKPRKAQEEPATSPFDGTLRFHLRFAGLTAIVAAFFSMAIGGLIAQRQAGADIEAGGFWLITGLIVVLTHYLLDRFLRRRWLPPVHAHLHRVPLIYIVFLILFFLPAAVGFEFVRAVGRPGAVMPAILLASLPPILVADYLGRAQRIIWLRFLCWAFGATLSVVLILGGMADTERKRQAGPADPAPVAGSRDATGEVAADPSVVPSTDARLPVAPRPASAGDAGDDRGTEASD